MASLARAPLWIGGQFLDLVCPSLCASCGAGVDRPGDTLCGSCWGDLRQTLEAIYCPGCGHTIGSYSLIDDHCHQCQRHRRHVSRVVRVGPYEQVLQQLIWALKYRHQSRLDRFLGGLLAAAVLGDARMGQIDCLVPVPLHWRRLWKRKYNHAELLARQCRAALKGQGIDIPVRTDLLRVRATEPQFSLPISRRAANLKDCFAVRPDAPYTGKHICLIDDITTTGTTLHIAGRTLKNAGAARISAAVLAAAVNG